MSRKLSLVASSKPVALAALALALAALALAACGRIDQDSECTCTEQYSPVCGADGTTYGNACLAHCAGVSARAGACTDAGAHDGATPDAVSRACVRDSDCVFAAGAGCCGVCLAEGSPVPPPNDCGASCAPVTHGCACIDGQCGFGTLALGEPCDPNHDLCGPSALCCSWCPGVPPPDGGTGCTAPVCTTPMQLSGLEYMCPMAP